MSSPFTLLATRSPLSVQYSMCTHSTHTGEKSCPSKPTWQQDVKDGTETDVNIHGHIDGLQMCQTSVSQWVTVRSLKRADKTWRKTCLSRSDRWGWGKKTMTHTGMHAHTYEKSRAKSKDLWSFTTMDWTYLEYIAPQSIKQSYTTESEQMAQRYFKRVMCCLFFLDRKPHTADRCYVLQWEDWLLEKQGGTFLELVTHRKHICQFNSSHWHRMCVRDQSIPIGSPGE